MTLIHRFVTHILLLIGIGLAASTASHAQGLQPTVTIVNPSDIAVLVKLMGPSRKDIAVPRQDQRTVSAVGGHYYILVRYGSGRYERGDSFTVKQTPRAVSRIRITLRKVRHGNYRTRAISKAEFNRAGLTGVRPSRAKRPGRARRAP